MGFLKGMTTYLFRRDEWEALCEHCGLCCYERTVYDDGEMAIDLNAPCEFLNTETNLCAVYPKRFERCPGCTKITPRIATSKYFLPPTCAYRRLFRS